MTLPFPSQLIYYAYTYHSALGTQYWVWMSSIDSSCFDKSHFGGLPLARLMQTGIKYCSMCAFLSMSHFQSTEYAVFTIWTFPKNSFTVIWYQDWNYLLWFWKLSTFNYNIAKNAETMVMMMLSISFDLTMRLFLQSLMVLLLPCFCRPQELLLVTNINQYSRGYFGMFIKWDEISIRATIEHANDVVHVHVVKKLTIEATVWIRNLMTKVWNTTPYELLVKLF